MSSLSDATAAVTAMLISSGCLKKTVLEIKLLHKQEMCLSETQCPLLRRFDFFYLWPWRMTLTFHHSKCAAPWDTHACQISSCYDQYCKSYDHFSKPKRKCDGISEGQTDGPTDSVITICHPTGDIKKTKISSKMVKSLHLLNKQIHWIAL